MPSSSTFCGSCGGENPPEAIRCVHCSDLLDASAASTPAAAPTPLHVRSIGVVAMVASVLLVVLATTGLGFSMRVLPADALDEDNARRIEAMVEDEVLERGDARRLAAKLAEENAGHRLLASGSLSDTQAAALRDDLPPADQSTVIGARGLLGIPPIIGAFLLAAVAGVVTARGRRTREVALGLAGAAALQLGLWMFAAEFNLDAVLEGRLMMAGAGPVFTGAPVLLMVCSLLFAVAVGTGLGHAVGLGLDQAAGKRDCPHCGHVFAARRDLHHCPACTRPLAVAPTAPQIGTGGMTLASTGASELLCTRCAKTYASDTCPIHPDEPLLDPRREDVRFQLLELDASAGTRRFASWTEGLGVGQRDAPVRTGEGLCMACARTYDAAVCPIHVDEPLLDPTREDVILELIEADDRRRRQVGTRLMFGGFAAAAALTTATVSTLELDGSLSISVFAGTVLAAMAIARVLTPALSPPRFGRWTGAAPADANAVRTEARRELLEPVLRAVRGDLRRLGWFAVASVVGASAGAAIGFAMGWPVGLTALGGGVLGLLASAGVTAVRDTASDVRDAAKAVSDEWKDPYGS